MNISNTQIDIDTIPKVERLNYQGLSKKSLTANIIAWTIFWIVVALMGAIFLYYNPADLPRYMVHLIVGVVIILIITTYVVTIVGFRKKLYAIREKDIVYQSGLIWRRLTVLPYTRVQHAEVVQGPVDRIFELGTLKIYTAGGSSSDMTIAGLTFDQSQSIKHFILNQNKSDEEE